MSLDLCILASGSSGNCSVVRTQRGVVLIDGGLGPRTVERRLVDTGVRLDSIAGVCLTHLDRDHLNANFVTWLSRRQLAVFCHAEKVDALRRLARRQTCALNVQPFGDEPFEPVDGLKVQAVPLAHDAEGSHGFLLSVTEQRAGPDGRPPRAHRIGFATDLGRVPPDLLDRLCEAGGLDVLAIESNYCPQLQLASGRPAFLKQRIMGGAGHLSNLQAFNAVRQVMDRHERLGHELPASVVLLHRSRDCNCPDVVRTLFGRDARIASRLVLAEQGAATGWLRTRSGVAPPQQMVFGWG
jgi:phosphoribosyl 1,2-cyclic phosphodiesterase